VEQPEPGWDQTGAGTGGSGPGPLLPATHGSSDPAPPATLGELPVALAERLRFDSAAPARLRGAAVPAEVRTELASLWDGIIAEVYAEVGGMDRRTAFRRSTVTRVLARVASRILSAEQAVIFAGTRRPLRWKTPGRHVAGASVAGGASAAAQELATFTTAGTATSVAITSAVVGEVFETYVAASARSHQYRRAHRPVDPATVMIDLAEAAGYGDVAGRRATLGVTRQAARWLSERIIARTATRFARALVPVVGVAVGATMSGWSLHRVNQLPLRPPSELEVDALTSDLGDLGDDPRWSGETPGG